MGSPLPITSKQTPQTRDFHTPGNHRIRSHSGVIGTIHGRTAFYVSNSRAMHVQLNNHFGIGVAVDNDEVGTEERFHVEYWNFNTTMIASSHYDQGEGNPHLCVGTGIGEVITLILTIGRNVEDLLDEFVERHEE